MTTIVCNTEMLACDTLVSTDDFICETRIKLFHYPGYGAVALCGNLADQIPVVKWFFKGADTVSCPNGNWALLALNCDGRIFRASNNEPLYEISNYDCIGAGELIARGAYEVCNDPVKTIQAVANINHYTNDVISTYLWRDDKAYRAITVTEEFLNEQFSAKPRSKSETNAMARTFKRIETP